MKQNINTIEVVKQLYHLYPDIQGQLCSRHSTLFGKLRTTFNKLYDNMQPNHYVIVKGNCQFVEQQLTQLKLSMALQNGAIILVSKTYPNSQIFVNSNHFSEELIFSHTGQLQQGLNTLSDQLGAIIRDANQNLSENELNGGIMYIHANIPENEFSYKESFLMSFYLAVLSINDNLKNFTKQKLIDKMSNLKFMGTRENIQRQFLGYHNRKFTLTLPDLLSMKDRSLNPIDLEENSNPTQPIQQLKPVKQAQNIVQKSQLLLDMNKDFKFLFCKLDLAKEDVNYEFRRREQIQTRKQQLLTKLSQSYQITGLFQLFHKINQVNLQSIQFKSQYQKTYMPKSMQELQFEDNDQVLRHPNMFLQALLRQIELVSEFSNENINLEQLIDEIWQINSKSLKLHSDEVVELVEDMKETLEIKGCMVVNQDFLMIVVQSKKFTELLCEVKHKMNKGELKSKSLFKIEDEELVVQRWSSDKVIGQKIFSSVPAEGAGIFDPSESIWFD